MTGIQIIYESKYGQTQKIAERIALIALRNGHRAHVTAIAALDPRRLPDAKAYVVLAPVFFGKHPPAIRDFVVRHGDSLNRRPSAFVSVSGAAGSARREDRDGARQRAVELLATTCWNPNLVESIGGAIAYPKYGFFTRLMMKMLSKREGRPTDTSTTHELTDWNAVERLTHELLAHLEPSPVTSQNVPMA